MKPCTCCGRENEEQATRCQECGADFAQNSPPKENTPEESDAAERFEKIAVLDNEVQAELIDGVLSDRNIPHIMQTYHDSALDGLFQGGKGWGVILAHESSRGEIVAALAEIRRQAPAHTRPPPT